MWNTAELAYLAGIIDGEGCITALFAHRQSKYIPHFGVTTTASELTGWLQAHFGGKVYTRIPQKGVENRKVKYEWVVSQSGIDAIFPEVMPFLVIKRVQAETMIAFRKTFVRNRRVVPDEILAHRIALFHTLKSLNIRGTMR